MMDKNSSDCGITYSVANTQKNRMLGNICGLKDSLSRFKKMLLLRWPSYHELWGKKVLIQDGKVVNMNLYVPIVSICICLFSFLLFFMVMLFIIRHQLFKGDSTWHYSFFYMCFLQYNVLLLHNILLTHGP